MNAPTSTLHLLPGLDHEHLDALEEEAIFILREVAATFERPALLFFGGKDSCVMLRLAEKAFKSHLGGNHFSGQLPFPLLHVDTGHNFPEVIEFRDRRVAEMGELLLVGSVVALRRAGGALERAQTGQSAGVVLDRQIDVSRGDWLAAPGELRSVKRFAATLAGLDTEAATPGRKYLVRHGNRWVHARLAQVSHRLDVHTLAHTAADRLEVNDIGAVVFELQQALPLSTFAANRVGGALIVVDPASHRTSGALLVTDTELAS